MDHSDEGFWCDHCDGFTYYSGTQHHRFTLILEEKGQAVTPVPSVPIKLKKQLSPLRYPGGKSKFIPVLYHKLQEGKYKTLVSPYTGGGSAELALLEAGVIDKLILNDKDVGIYALFWVIKHMPEELVKRIRSCKPTHRMYFDAQQVVKADYVGCTLIEAAWITLLVNRLAFSGIYYANPLGGRHGAKEELLSRWNPEQLCSRIETIHHLADRYEILNQDACELIEEEYWRPTTTIFIDPPYVAKGKSLYRHYYDESEHYRLQLLLDSLHSGTPGADIILTYDNAPLIERIYQYPSIEKLCRVYSI
ncbi:DNA adenine methylase [Paenibacillus agilis]|uniref:site-specific DNA-methyltransferase (adenine-specific) n=1 Tax=Paenibacillus agilis TaxID=3020863 RepID=A0A559IDC9_9BACL|nr:DNA adenine methylase [Paenibacillus agilis]